MKKLQFNQNVSLGCDPEFFFVNDSGSTVGAEKVIPEEGITYKAGSLAHGVKYDGAHTSVKGYDSKVIIDGVQAELNPRANNCRANLGNEIGACFKTLAASLKERGIDAKVFVAPLVKVTKKEMDSLSDKSKIFGCGPSQNVYTGGESQIKVDPKKYNKRGAGGHIHLGAYNDGYNANEKIKTALQNIPVIIPLLDLLLGNTCVLMDRNPDNIERRKNYGRSGEYRIKEYGLEYRTLSNFWLRNYKLMSFVTGLARFIVHVASQSSPEEIQELLAKVPTEDVKNAINNNDFDLAYNNFLKMEDSIIELAGEYTSDSYPLTSETIKAFHWYVKKGVDHWFPEDAFAEWLQMKEGHGTGWESFAKREVKNHYIANKTESDKLFKELQDRKQGTYTVELV